ncbi:MAG: cell division protein ZapA [Roseovarius sp.]|jgi:cell division protein ZapA|nr:cell division protein ZapA [Roseovarius sp.]
MPEVQIEIGGRTFEVACQAGEEHYLQSAAKMLDEEASVLAAQIGRIPEPRMLLMAGLMLADKTAGLQDKLAEKDAELDQMRNAPTPEAQRIEVPVVPQDVTDTLAEIAARAEALAETVDGSRAG